MDAEDRATLAEIEAQERVSSMEVESTVALASTHEETDSLVRIIALVEGELAEVHRAGEVAEETTRGLFDAPVEAKRCLEEPERGHQEQLKELTIR
jgi:hypothetical protein